MFKKALLFVLLFPISISSLHAESQWTMTLPGLKIGTERSINIISHNFFYGGKPVNIEYGMGCGTNSWLTFPAVPLARQVGRYISYFPIDTNLQNIKRTQLLASIKKFFHTQERQWIGREYPNDCARFSLDTARGVHQVVTVSGTGSATMGYMTSFDGFSGSILHAPLIAYGSERRPVSSKLVDYNIGGILAGKGFLSLAPIIGDWDAGGLSQYWQDDRDAVVGDKTIKLVLFPDTVTIAGMSWKTQSIIPTLSVNFSIPLGTHIGSASWGNVDHTTSKIQVQETTMQHLYDGDFDVQKTGNLYCAYRDDKNILTQPVCSMLVRDIKKIDKESLIFQVVAN